MRFKSLTFFFSLGSVLDTSFVHIGGINAKLALNQTSPVAVTVLQVCERLVEKVIQVKAYTVPSPTAFRGD